MPVKQDRLRIRTRPASFLDLTGDIARWLSGQPKATGLLHLFLRHTSASLLIQENADPDVLHDLHRFMERVAPHDSSLYHHCTEGPDDMPAHIRTMLTQTALAVPVFDGTLLLGTWQAIYLYEHRDRGHDREIVLSFAT